MNLHPNLYQSQHNFDVGKRVEASLRSFYPGELSGIVVRVFYGIVELTGLVESESLRNAAVEIAEHVAGISTVFDSIRVRSPRQMRRPRFLPATRLQPIGSNAPGHAL